MVVALGGEVTTSIGDRLTQIRGSRSQAEFAKEIGVHKNTLGGYERGERTPDAVFLRNLMTTGYNANWVISGEGPMLINNHEGIEEAPVMLQHIDEQRISSLKAGTKLMLETSQESEYNPPAVWSALIIELMVGYGLTADGAERMLETLAAIEDRNKPTK